MPLFTETIPYTPFRLPEIDFQHQKLYCKYVDTAVYLLFKILITPFSEKVYARVELVEVFIEG